MSILTFNDNDFVFGHALDWGGSNEAEETFCPVDGAGNIIPHIWGHVFPGPRPKGRTSGVYYAPLAVDWRSFDCYEAEETVTVYRRQSAAQMLVTGGSTTVNVGHPTSVVPFTGVPTSEFHTWEECELGCYGCGYEDLWVGTCDRIVSGALLVPKNSIISGMEWRESGSSCFPDIFPVGDRWD